MKENIKATINNLSEYIKQYIISNGKDGIVFDIDNNNINSLIIQKICEYEDIFFDKISIKENFKNQNGFDTFTSEMRVFETALKIKNEVGENLGWRGRFEFKEELYTNLEEAFVNMHSKIKIIYLYTYAQATNQIVVETSNLFKGYCYNSPKWIDFESIFNPLLNFTEAEILEIAKFFKLC